MEVVLLFTLSRRSLAPSPSNSSEWVMEVVLLFTLSIPESPTNIARARWRLETGRAVCLFELSLCCRNSCPLHNTCLSVRSGRVENAFLPRPFSNPSGWPFSRPYEEGRSWADSFPICPVECTEKSLWEDVLAWGSWPLKDVVPRFFTKARWSLTLDSSTVLFLEKLSGGWDQLSDRVEWSLSDVSEPFTECKSGLEMDSFL